MSRRTPEERQKRDEFVIREEAAREDKCKFENLQRFIHKHRHELEAEEKQLQKQENTALLKLQFNQDESLARELERVKNEEIADKKYRQQLRETSHELKDLEKKLMTGYMRKELLAQIAEKEAQKEFEKAKIKEEHERMKKAVETEAESVRNKAQENLQKTLQYRKELQDQMIYQEHMKRFKYEEFLREKKMIDDIVLRIYEEDERIRVDKMCKIQRTKEDIIAFNKAREVLKQKKKEEIEEENRKIHEYLMSKATHMSVRSEEKAQREAEKCRVIETMLEQMYYDLASQREREEIIQELYLQENQQKMESKHREAIEKAFRQKLEMRQSLFAQIQEKQERKKQAAEEDAAFREESTARLMEDYKLEQLSNQQRRLKMIQIRKEVQQMMLDKRQKHAEELQREKISREQEQKEDERRRRIIDEERINMLKEHCKHLVGYLPKGILKEDDLVHLDQAVYNK